jgi:hypothetical protein
MVPWNKPGIPAAVLAAAFLAGCAGPPRFARVDEAPGMDGAPDMEAVVRHVQCELLDLLDEADKAPAGPLGRLRAGDYVAYASLTLDVVAKEGVTPSLAYITPFSTAGTQRSFGLGGELSGERHRNMTQTFTFLLKKPSSPPASPGCPELQSRLRGDLGLRQVVLEGLKSSQAQVLPFLNGEDPDVTAAGLTGDTIPNFGSTVEFTVVYGLNFTPTWTLTHFNGPAADGSLLNASREVKDSLTIAFAAVPKSAAKAAPPQPSTAAPPAPSAAGQAQAAQVARDAVFRMLLQGINRR